MVSPHSLPVEHLVQFIVSDLKSNVVRRHRFSGEIAWQPVMLGGESSPFIEITLDGKHFLTECHYIVAVHVQSIKCIHHVKVGLKCFRLVHDGKGDEKAHAR